MAKWEYLGKREIMRRVSALGYSVASGRLFGYAKFEGVEWLESPELKITVQRGGDWLQITRKKTQRAQNAKRIHMYAITAEPTQKVIDGGRNCVLCYGCIFSTPGTVPNYPFLVSFSNI